MGLNPTPGPAREAVRQAVIKTVMKWIFNGRPVGPKRHIEGCDFGELGDWVSDAVEDALTTAPKAPTPSAPDVEELMRLSEGGDWTRQLAFTSACERYVRTHILAGPSEAAGDGESAQDQLAYIESILSEGQGDDDGAQILPDFEEAMTTAAKVEACLHLLERRRDAMDDLIRRLGGRP